MHENGDQLKKKFLSTDITVRVMAVRELYNRLRDRTILKFYYGTEDRQDAEDMIQQTYVNFDKRLREGPLLPEQIPEAYFYAIVNNLLTDWYRKRNVENNVLSEPNKNEDDEEETRYTPKELSWGRLEDGIIYEGDHQNILHMLSLIPRENDRIIARWHYLHGFKPKQIYLLTGWNIKEIQNSRRRIKRYVKRMMPRMDKIEDKTGPWEQKLAFTGKRNPTCITLLNVFPQKIHPDSEADLLKDLDVGSLKELWDKYVVLLRSEGINMTVPNFGLTFMQRKYFRNEVFYEGETIIYAEFVASFERVHHKGGWQDMLTLTKTNEYPGQFADPEFQDGRWVGISNVLPTLGIRVRKAFTTKLIDFLDAPDSVVPATYVYQLEPLDNKNGIA